MIDPTNPAGRFRRIKQDLRGFRRFWKGRYTQNLWTEAVVHLKNIALEWSFDGTLLPGDDCRLQWGVEPGDQIGDLKIELMIDVIKVASVEHGLFAVILGHMPVAYVPKVPPPVKYTIEVLEKPKLKLTPQVVNKIKKVIEDQISEDPAYYGKILELADHKLLSRSTLGKAFGFDDEELTEEQEPPTPGKRKVILD